MIDTWDQQPTHGKHFSQTTIPASNEPSHPAAGPCSQGLDCGTLHRLDTTQQLAGIGDWEYDLASDTVIWSRNIYRLLGRDPLMGHMTLKEYLFHYSAADSARLQETIHCVIQHNEQRTVEVRARLAKGNSPLHRCTFIPAHNRNGAVVRINCFLQEITNQNLDYVETHRHKSRALTNTESYCETPFRISIPDGTFEYINSRVTQLTGYPPRDWYRKPFLIRDILFPGWQRKFDRAYKRFLDGETGSDLTIPILTRQREMRWLRLSATVFKDHTGEIIAVEGVATDITDRKREASERRQLIRQLRKVLVGKHSLNGLIPICSYCKKVRDDQGLWKQIELFLTEHGRLFFTHGLCPDCLVEHYPQYMFKQSGKKQEL